MPLTFGIAFDYLCPWARKAHLHVLTGLRHDANWDVKFVPFSLAQCHVHDGEAAIWDRTAPADERGILALQVGITVRDHHPESFLDAHEALFSIRHVQARNLSDRAVIADVLDRIGLDGDTIVAEASRSDVTAQLAAEHQQAVDDDTVWGVPTFIGRDRAVFVRILDEPDGDPGVAIRRIEDIMRLVDAVPQLHEFKQTTLHR